MLFLFISDRKGITVIARYSEVELAVFVGGDTCSMVANSGVRDAD